MNNIIKLKRVRSFQEKVYFDYADSMILLCYRYTGNLLDAEEIMNNGFLKVFKHYSKFDEKHEYAFSAWIKKIMINECLMHLRKQKGFNIISIDENKFDKTEATSFSSLDLDCLLNLLKELPVGYRTVFNLYVIEGYNHPEISAKLMISESTSRTQLLKARNKLRLMIKTRNLRYG